MQIIVFLLDWKDYPKIYIEVAKWGVEYQKKQTNNGVNLEIVYLRFLVGGELAQTVTQYQSFT